MSYTQTLREYAALVARLEHAEREGRTAEVLRLGYEADRLWSRVLAAFESDRRAGLLVVARGRARR